MNNKGSFKNESTFGKRLLGFFKESGFYIAIAVGLCALAAGAVFFSTNQILTDPDDNAREDDIGIEDGDRFGIIDFGLGSTGDENSDQSSITDNEGSDYAGTDYSDENPDGSLANEDVVTDDSAVGQDDPADNDTAGAGTADNDGETAQNVSGSILPGDDDTAPAEAVVLAIVKPNFQAPLSGKIQSAYSMDKLVFSPTFNEWRTHSGVDISAPRGEVVKAVGNGAVSEIKNDPRYGFTIVIDHKNGYKSLYANLASDKTMKVGQEVKLGDPIGSVGATAIFESAEPTHIHFELYKENKLVDPEAYIEFPK